jgi:hypothetical protein
MLHALPISKAQILPSCLIRSRVNFTFNMILCKNVTVIRAKDESYLLHCHVITPRLRPSDIFRVATASSYKREEVSTKFENFCLEFGYIVLALTAPLATRIRTCFVCSVLLKRTSVPLY